MIGAQKMDDIDLAKHIAVSSHESVLHATNKDPRCIQVTWFLGKRCNFDCSYCSALTHDNFSKHIKTTDAFTFIDNLNKHCFDKNKKFNLNITGGEPFVHPEFISIIKYASTKKQIFQLGVVTNGSMPIEKYQEAISFLNWITISIHFEQTLDEIKKLVDKIIILNLNKKIHLNVNIMALPGKFEQVKWVIEQLSCNSVKYVLKKIDPPDKINNSEWHKGNLEKKNINKLDLYDDASDKKKFRKNNTTNITNRYDNYYSAEERDFLLREGNTTKELPNLKLHFNDRVLLFHSERLKKFNLNIWKKWICYIGIESLFVQYDGKIYRGLCMEGNQIGHISDVINWPKTPIICGLDQCLCQTDMCTKKIKEQKHVKLFE